MSMTSNEERIAALERRVAELERNPSELPRLGPRPPDAAEVKRQTDRFVDAVKKAIDEADAEPKICTTSGEPVAKVRAEQTESTGQHKAYVVLCEEERAKGFVRPYRDRYKHVGVQPTYQLADLTPEQVERFGAATLSALGYVKFEAYPPGSPETAGGGNGRYWTKLQLRGGCGTVTTMGRALSETYARDPKFYGATFCIGCNKHLPVGEFVWSADGEEVGS